MKNKLLNMLSNKMALVIFCMSALLYSCSKDWLDIKADKRQATPHSITDMQAILDQPRMNLIPSMALEVQEIAADGHYYTDAIFENYSSSPSFQNPYSWSVLIPFSLDLYGIPTYYQNPYSAIADCNVVLSIPQGANNKNEFDHVRAQALFHRARAYFYLAQTFATQYNELTAEQDLGLPLRLNTNITESSRRSSVKETYQQIIDDLKTALEHLSIDPQLISRASRPAALGTLARVYLCMGNYDSAFKYSNEYLLLKNELLDYSTLSISAPAIGINEEVPFFDGTGFPSSALSSYYLIDQELYDSYSDDDLRKQIFFTVGSAGITFKGDYTPDHVSHSFRGVATDEVYLIRAECYARKGDFIHAIQDLNDLLRTRWKKNPDGSSMYIDQIANNELEALTKIFQERRKELILRGVRWMDLRRLNLDDRFKVTLTRTILGKQYTLEPGSPNYTFPFPQDVIDLSGMQQNPAWE